MIDFNLWEILVICGAICGVMTFLLAVIGLLLAPIIIDKADNALAVLLPKSESLFKGWPVSIGRLATYGRLLLLRRWYHKRVFDGHPERVTAVESAPAWIKGVTKWIYAPLMPLCAMTLVFVGLMKLTE
ncbi:hypothetical protein [Chromohalobacter israelensis]|uniref:hypothetical protein n=1 Tax=Chromohalobacter israelensis TaxID=141390 RepID=UPI000FFF3D6D|nr:hypothetical protein [Chromohalobacter salexigens]RXE46469.1 hypothetical protein B4O83_00015 [Chromohalobacter salexigens]